MGKIKIKKQDKRLIIFIGKTHSGKTTFAKKLEKVNKNFLVLEGDPIEIFLKKEFPKLKELNDKKQFKLHQNTSLLHEIFLLFLKFALMTGKPIILSNANIWRSWRGKMIKLSRKFNYKTIGVYFDFSEEFLLQRVKKAKRTTEMIREAKNFRDLLISQKSRIQIPKNSEFDKFFVIKSEKDLNKIQKELIINN